MGSLHQEQTPWRKIVHHPLLHGIADIADASTGVGFLVVYPTESGWGQSSLDGEVAHLPEFCRLIHSSKDGAAHCRLCHVLMAIGACSGEPGEQRCHAGASVLVCPAPPSTAENLAVISSCQFSDAAAWEHVRKTAEKLGLDVDAVRKAYLKLPAITEERRRTVQAAMQAINAAIAVLRENDALQARLHATTRSPEPGAAIAASLNEIRDASDSGASAQVPGNMPPLIRVVCTLINQRPDLPLTVKQLADAAHVTPNYFTALFHQHTGKSFTDYLTGVRIGRAKELLLDFTLNVNDVARLVGYGDAGYFARRFRRSTGMSPRDWRKSPDL